MYLLPNEEELVSSNGDKIILTDQRIVMNYKVWGKTNHIAIFLEDISSVENIYRNNLYYLGLALCCLFLAMLTSSNFQNPTWLYFFLTFGTIFFLLWISSRRHLIVISSKGGNALKFEVDGMADQEVAEFVYKVQVAKQQRIKYLYRL